ncbi:MAG: hypothetical protein K2Y14_02220 [Burkholderiales bacterium]|nr:hypothetical protein [Burkholderiales bacterium]
MFNLKLRNKYLISLLLAFGISTTSFASECDSKKLEPVFDLMVQRTKLMEGVAAYKFTQKQQPYDAATELKVLSNVHKIAEDNKLDPSDLMVFAQIQMDQAKQVQQYWLNYWGTHATNQPDPAITPGIDSLRQQINAIDAKLYSKLIANLANLQICSQAEMRKQMSAAYTDVRGIPSTPDYNSLTVSALSNISPTGQQ